jgi:NAD(P)H-hydrate epimerase
VDDSHKFDYGRVVVIGGASGMAGAPALTAMAALKSGAGLVELLVPDCVAVVAAGFDPCVMTLGLPSADGGFGETAVPTILERSARADVVACGPGLGRGGAASELVAELWRRCERPCVFDADALSALAHESAGSLATHPAPRILTPHEGEMRRLTRRDDRPARVDLESLATLFATQTDSIVLLKGPRSLVTCSSGSWHNDTGNPGMATAGAGDVLTGVVAALVAQKLSAPDAARLAAWVHGRAGDLAAETIGQISLTAVDILRSLPAAFLEITARRASPSG